MEHALRVTLKIKGECVPASLSVCGSSEKMFSRVGAQILGPSRFARQECVDMCM